MGNTAKQSHWQRAERKILDLAVLPITLDSMLEDGGSLPYLILREFALIFLLSCLFYSLNSSLEQIFLPKMDLPSSFLTMLSKSGCGTLPMKPTLREVLLAEATLFVCHLYPTADYSRIDFTQGKTRTSGLLSALFFQVILF